MSEPRRFRDPGVMSEQEAMQSIAMEDGSEGEMDALASANPPPSAIPAMAVKPSRYPAEGSLSKSENSEADENNDAEPAEAGQMAQQELAAEAEQPAAKKTTITEALSKDELNQEEAAEIGSETIEWVGKDRRIKRVKKTPSTIYLKSSKPPKKLIITDDYHQSMTELMGISDVRKYGARPGESKWLYSGTKFNCELRHPIPGFGYAVMKQGIQEPLQFLVETDGLSGGSGLARIQSHPPEWKRFTHVKDLGVVNIEPDKKVLFTVTNEWVKRLMLELKDGMVPTISFWDDDTGGEDVVLTVSSFNFQKHLPDFSKCLGNLLPYSFKDVKKRTVYFGYDKYKLSDKQRERLNRLIEYVKLDEEVKKVDITGFSDSVGFARYNRTLAQRRANAVKKYMISKGLPAKKLVVKSRGEKGKKHSNRTEAGRRKNRRVEVTLVK